MVALSMVLVGLAALALVAGLLRGGLGLIWVSIGLCVVAALLLGVGVLRLRSLRDPDGAEIPADPWGRPAPADGGSGGALDQEGVQRGSRKPGAAGGEPSSRTADADAGRPGADGRPGIDPPA